LKIVLVVVGLLIVIVGAFFQFSPQAFGSLSYATGLSTSQVTYYPTTFLQIQGSNYSFIPVKITPQDNLSVQIHASPSPVTFLLMNSGNFSEWKNSASSSYSVYPQSKLNVLNYSFFLADASVSGNIYLVFLGQASNTNTSVLVNLTVVTNNTASWAWVIPLIIIIAGLAVLVVGTNTSRKRPQRLESSLPEQFSSTSATQTVSVVSAQPVCRFCGATLKTDSPFCPSCDKSQL
jgi:hypothetical protein